MNAVQPGQATGDKSQGTAGRPTWPVFSRMSSVPCLLLLLVGCTTHPVAPGLPPDATPATVPAAVAPGEAAIEITSEPAMAFILVNDQLSGRTPLRLTVKVSSQGFCADYLTIKARFVAPDASQVTQTQEVQLTPREKAPVALVFTPLGVQRRLR